MNKKSMYSFVLIVSLLGLISLSAKIQNVRAPYPVITIEADGSISPPSANITTLDNVTYTFTEDINAFIIVEKDNIVVDGASYTVQGPGSTGFGIRLNGRNNVTIKNVEVINFTAGIYLSSSTNNNIIGNTVSSNNEDGIVLSYSSNNTVIGNTVSNDYEGIYLGHSSNNTITGNNVSNHDNGIFLYYSNRTKITSNTVSDNTDGIDIFFSSHNNTVTGNTVSNNDIGIYLGHSSNNVFTGNTVSNNSYGGIGLYSSSNNVLFHNNFIDNAEQVTVSPDDMNAWDDDVEGNYWSNYTGVDSNHDGIGDTPHVISANNTDYYPLMGMFHSFNTSVGKNVNIISNSTIESFEYEPSGTIRFYVSNMTSIQTQGFCRASIPYDVLSEPFNVTVDGANPTYWNYTLYDNGTHRWIYFEYEHSTKEVVIIPEFPTFIILPLFMAATLLAALANRRKHSSLE